MPAPREPEKNAVLDRAMLATIQHELRTPATNIIGYTRVLLEDSPPGYANDLGEILKASNALLNKINHFLELGENIGRALDPVNGVDPAANLRHDLRSPMNVILGYVEFLLEEAQAQNDTQVLRDLLRISQLTESMVSVVNRITGELGSGQPNYQTVDQIHPDLRLVTQALRTLEILEVTPGRPEAPARVLVVDDNEQNLDLMCRHLRREGHRAHIAENGSVALQMLRRDYFDIVLLDIIMPEMNGYEVLVEMKKDKRLRQIPVIMISALEELDSVVRCIELGADEYLPKSFDPAMLRARLAASLEKKRLRDRERHYLEQIRIERERSERLLLDVLPNAIVERLKNGEKTIADDVDLATVLFCDLVGFTEFSARSSAAEVVHRLNEIFLRFDTLVEKHGLEKIKSIGDAYLVVGGLPASNPDHARAVSNLALDMRDTVVQLNKIHANPLEFRIGVHTGSIVAGVIGRKRFTYDVWGDTVNVASRMESQGVPGKIQVSEASYGLLKDAYEFEHRGSIAIKGKGEMSTYFLTGRR